MKCKVCGCTDDYGCAGGCTWVAPGLCSACIPKLYDKAIKNWGVPAQLNMVKEECAELIVAVSHFNRVQTTEHYRDLVEEITDVEIMLEQLKMIMNVDASDWTHARSMKLMRLHKRLEVSP